MNTIFCSVNLIAFKLAQSRLAERMIEAVGR